MTSQISDTLLFEDKEFRIGHISGKGLYNPYNLGIKIAEISTACYRGFHCGYVVKENRLYLSRLNIGLYGATEEDAIQGVGPVIFGKLPHRYLETITYKEYSGILFDWLLTRFKPYKTEIWESADWLVDELNEPIAFTGGLLAGHEVIPGMGTDMVGFWAAFRYRIAYEFQFKEGQLTDWQDRTAEMDAFRRAREANDPSLIQNPELLQRYMPMEYESHLNYSAKAKHK